MRLARLLTLLTFAAATSAQAQSVTSVQVATPGSFSCSTPPVVSFAAGAGTGATGYAQMFPIPGTSTYGVNAVIVTSGGNSYTGSFLLSFSSPCLTVQPNATALVPLPAEPGQCTTGLYSIGISGTFAANCTQVLYSQLGSPPSALPPNGSASGDLCSTYPAPTVCKIEGGAIPANTNHAGYNSSGQPIASPNTLGCIDGYDHLPCTVYEMGLTSQSTPSGSFATAFTTAAAGVYRITGTAYATTTSSTTFSVSLNVKEAQIGSVSSHSLALISATIGTSESWNNGTLVTQNLAASTPVQWETVGTGTNTSGVWSFDLIIERVK